MAAARRNGQGTAGTARNGEHTLLPEEGWRVKIVMDSGWQEHVSAACDDLFRDHLGPAIRDDARRYCPKDTGALAGSIEDHVEDHTLIVSATGSEERAYASFVELGHRIVAYGHQTGRVQPPRPYLRPALYTTRGA